MDVSGLSNQLHLSSAPLASEKDLLRVHPASYLEPVPVDLERRESRDALIHGDGLEAGEAQRGFIAAAAGYRPGRVFRTVSLEDGTGRRRLWHLVLVGSWWYTCRREGGWRAPYTGP